VPSTISTRRIKNKEQEKQHENSFVSVSSGPKLEIASERSTGLFILGANEAYQSIGDDESSADKRDTEA
jgi:hypothetical protein